MTRSPKPPKESPPPTFEQSLAELESIVDTLERGELTLEESLGAFERGVALTKSCQTALEAAEQRVRILTEPGVDAEPEPFAASAGESR